MGQGCCGIGIQGARNFLTKEERISLLKEYKDDLRKKFKELMKELQNLKSRKILSLIFPTRIRIS